MADDVPKGFYRGSNGRLYPNKRTSLLQRTQELGSERALGVQGPAPRSRNDGLDVLASNMPSVFSGDPDFGVGYEVMDAKSSNPLGRARAQKIGYNKDEQYLAILMRDNTMVGYPGVTPDEWDDYQGYSSTSDYIDTVLSRYKNKGWQAVTAGNLPQSNPQNFTQGTID